jgi:hypothetical protein
MRWGWQWFLVVLDVLEGRLGVGRQLIQFSPRHSASTSFIYFRWLKAMHWLENNRSFFRFPYPHSFSFSFSFSFESPFCRRCLE